MQAISAYSLGDNVGEKGVPFRERVATNISQSPGSCTMLDSSRLVIGIGVAIIIVPVLRA